MSLMRVPKVCRLVSVATKAEESPISYVAVNCKHVETHVHSWSKCTIRLKCKTIHVELDDRFRDGGHAPDVLSWGSWLGWRRRSQWPRLNYSTGLKAELIQLGHRCLTLWLSWMYYMSDLCTSGAIETSISWIALPTKSVLTSGMDIRMYVG